MLRFSQPKNILYPHGKLIIFSKSIRGKNQGKNKISNLAYTGTKVSKTNRRGWGNNMDNFFPAIFKLLKIKNFKF